MSFKKFEDVPTELALSIASEIPCIYNGGTFIAFVDDLADLDLDMLEELSKYLSK